MILAMFLTDLPTWLAIVIAVITYFCLGLVMLAAICGLAIVLQERARRAAARPDAFLQELHVTRDLGYRRPQR